MATTNEKTLSEKLASLQLSIGKMKLDTDSIFFCDFCSEMTQGQAAYKSHMNGKPHRNATTAVLNEPIRYKIETNLKSKPPQVMNVYYCLICRFDYPNLHTALMHLEDPDHKIKAYRLDQINKMFSVTKDLTHPCTEIRFCPTCNLTTESTKALNVHRTSMQHQETLKNRVEDFVRLNGTRPLSIFCGVCSLSVSAATEWKAHEESKTHKKNLMTLIHYSDEANLQYMIVDDQMEQIPEEESLLPDISDEDLQLHLVGQENLNPDIHRDTAEFYLDRSSYTHVLLHSTDKPWHFDVWADYPLSTEPLHFFFCTICFEDMCEPCRIDHTGQVPVMYSGIHPTIARRTYVTSDYYCTVCHKTFEYITDHDSHVDVCMELEDQMETEEGGVTASTDLGFFPDNNASSFTVPNFGTEDVTTDIPPHDEPAELEKPQQVEHVSGGKQFGEKEALKVTKTRNRGSKKARFSVKQGMDKSSAEKVLADPIHFDYVKISTDSKAGMILKRYEVPFDLLQNDSQTHTNIQRTQLDMFTYLKMDAVITAQVTANSIQAGMAIMAVLPPKVRKWYPTVKMLTTAGEFIEDKTSKSGGMHFQPNYCLIPCNRSQTFELVVPFQYWTNLMANRSALDPVLPLYFGELYIGMLTDFMPMTGGSSNCDIQLSVSWQNLDLVGPRPPYQEIVPTKTQLMDLVRKELGDTPYTESAIIRLALALEHRELNDQFDLIEDMSDIVNEVITGVEDVVNVVGDVIEVGGKIASAVGKVFEIFGLSRPPAKPCKESQVALTQHRGQAHARGFSQAEQFGINSTTMSAPRDEWIQGTMPKSMNQLAMVPCLTHKFTITPETDVGTEIFRIIVSPQISNGEFIDNFVVPPCELVSTYYDNWHGSMIYTFMFVCSENTKARVAISHLFGRKFSETIDSKQKTHYVTNFVSIVGNTSKRYRTQYVQQYDYISVDRNAESAISSAGLVTMTLTQKMTSMSNAPQKIEVLVFTRCGPDSQFGGLGGSTVRKPAPKPSALAMVVEDQMSQDTGAFVPQTTVQAPIKANSGQQKKMRNMTTEMNEPHFGEDQSEFIQLMRKPYWQTNQTQTYPSVDLISWYHPESTKYTNSVAVNNIKALRGLWTWERGGFDVFLNVPTFQMTKVGETIQRTDLRGAIIEVAQAKTYHTTTDDITGPMMGASYQQLDKVNIMEYNVKWQSALNHLSTYRLDCTTVKNSFYISDLAIRTFIMDQTGYNKPPLPMKMQYMYAICGADDYCLYNWYATQWMPWRTGRGRFEHATSGTTILSETPIPIPTPKMIVEDQMGPCWSQPVCEDDTLYWTGEQDCNVVVIDQMEKDSGACGFTQLHIPPGYMLEAEGTDLISSETTDFRSVEPSSESDLSERLVDIDTEMTTSATQTDQARQDNFVSRYLAASLSPVVQTATSMRHEVDLMCDSTAMVAQSATQEIQHSATVIKDVLQYSMEKTTELLVDYRRTVDHTTLSAQSIMNTAEEKCVNASIVAGQTLQTAHRNFDLKVKDSIDSSTQHLRQSIEREVVIAQDKVTKVIGDLKGQVATLSMESFSESNALANVMNLMLHLRHIVKAHTVMDFIIEITHMLISVKWPKKLKDAVIGFFKGLVAPIYSKATGDTMILKDCIAGADGEEILGSVQSTWTLLNTISSFAAMPFMALAKFNQYFKKEIADICTAGRLVNACKSVAGLIKLVFDLFSWIMEKGYYIFTGQDFNTNARVSKFLEKARDLEVRLANPNYILSEFDRDNITELTAEAHQLGTADFSIAQRQNFNMAHQVLLRVTREAERRTSEMKTRPDPYCIKFYGKPGAGKTTYATRFLRDFPEIVDLPKEVYSINEKNERMDGYKGFENIMFDDFGQYRKDSCCEALMIMMNGNQAFMPLFAHMGDKGRTFKSKLMVLTGNEARFQDNANIRFTDAINRRVNDLVEVTVAPEHGERVGEVWILNNRPKNNQEHLLFQVLDPLTGMRKDGVEVMNHKQMLLYAKRRYTEHMDKQNQVIEELETCSRAVVEIKAEEQRIRLVQVDQNLAELFRQEEEQRRRLEGMRVQDQMPDVKMPKVDWEDVKLFMRAYNPDTTLDDCVRLRNMLHALKGPLVFYHDAGQVSNIVDQETYNIAITMIEIYTDVKIGTRDLIRLNRLLELTLCIKREVQMQQPWKCKDVFSRIIERITAEDGLIRSTGSKIWNTICAHPIVTMVGVLVSGLFAMWMIKRDTTKELEDQGALLMRFQQNAATRKPKFMRSMATKYPDLSPDVAETVFDDATHQYGAALGQLERDLGLHEVTNQLGSNPYSFDQIIRRKVTPIVHKQVNDQMEVDLSEKIVETVFRDQNADAVLNNRVLPNMVAIGFTRTSEYTPIETAQKVMGQGIGIQHGIVLTNKHVLKSIEESGSTMILMRKKHGQSIFTRHSYNPNRCFMHPTVDWGIYDFGIDIEAFKTITHNFLNHLSDYLTSEKIILGHVMYLKEQVVAEVMKGKPIKFIGTMELAEGSEQYMVGVRYETASIAGCSGSPLVLYNRRSERKIFGIHKGIESGTGFGGGIPILESELKEAIGTVASQIKQVFGYVDKAAEVPEMPDTVRLIDTIDLTRIEIDALFPATGDRCLTPIGFLASSVSPGSIEKTMYTKLPTFDKIHPHTTRPTLSRQEVARLGIPDPCKQQVEKYGRMTVPFAADIEEAVGWRVRTLWNESLDRYKEREPQLQTEAEIIAGNVNTDYIRPLNKDSSMGYPFSRRAKQAGKRDFMDFENGTIIDDEFRTTVDEAEAKLLKGERPMFFWQDCKKDARVPTEKVLKGKQRMFVISPCALTYICKKYMGDFIAATMAAHNDNSCAVGINPEGPEWAHLRNRLFPFGGRRVREGDQSNYDGAILNQWARVLLYTMQDFYKDEFFDMRAILFAELLQSVHILFNSLVGAWIVYSKHHGNNSGSVITTIFNSQPNDCMMRACFMEMYLNIAFDGPLLPMLVDGQNRLLKPDNSDEDLWDEYDTRGTNVMDVYDANVTGVYFGDDDIGESSEAVDYFNMVNIGTVMTVHGFQYTMATKGDEFVPFVKMDEAQFLKRKFRQDSEYVDICWAPVQLEPIFELMNWTKEGRVLEDCLQTNFDTYARYIAEHGRETYDFLVHRAAEIIRSQGYQVSIRNWHEFNLERKYAYGKICGAAGSLGSRMEKATQASELQQQLTFLASPGVGDEGGDFL